MQVISKKTATIAIIIAFIGIVNLNTLSSSEQNKFKKYENEMR